MNRTESSAQAEIIESMPQLLRLPAVLQATGLARSTVYRMVAEHTFRRRSNWPSAPSAGAMTMYDSGRSGVPARRGDETASHRAIDFKSSGLSWPRWLGSA